MCSGEECGFSLWKLQVEHATCPCVHVQYNVYTYTCTSEYTVRVTRACTLHSKCTCTVHLSRLIP